MTCVRRWVGGWVRVFVAAFMVPCSAHAVLAADAARAGPSTEKVHAARVQSTIQSHVVPHFQAVAEAAARLPPAVARACKTGTDGDREELSTHFRNVVVAWAGVAYLRFGPMAGQARQDRMSLWPDRRGEVARELGQLLASGDPAKFEGGALAKQSPAVQGLPALELLLTDSAAPLGPTDASSLRCKLASAIAVNVHGIAGELLQGWTSDGGWQEKMLRAAPGKEPYESAQDAARALVMALYAGLKSVADDEVKPHLYTTSKSEGPYAKSNLAAEYYEAGVNALNHFYDAMALESSLAGDKDWVKNSAGIAWNIVKSSDGAGGRGSGVAKGGQPSVQKVFAAMTTLRKLVATELSVSAGVPLLGKTRKTK